MRKNAKAGPVDLRDFAVFDQRPLVVGVHIGVHVEDDLTLVAIEAA